MMIPFHHPLFFFFLILIGRRNEVVRIFVRAFSKGSYEYSHFISMSYQDKKKEKKRMRKGDHHEGDSPHDCSYVRRS